MEKKKENSKGKHKAKITVGDIIFRIIVILAIFLSVLIAYVSYLQGIKNKSNLSNNVTQEINKTIDITKK